MGEYLISEYEIGRFMEMKEWSTDELSVEDELKRLAEMTAKEKNEIEETLKSRAFKIGKKLTRKKDRIVI